MGVRRASPARLRAAPGGTGRPDGPSAAAPCAARGRASAPRPLEQRRMGGAGRRPSPLDDGRARHRRRGQPRRHDRRRLEANLDRYDRAYPGRFATFAQLDRLRFARATGPRSASTWPTRPRVREGLEGLEGPRASPAGSRRPAGRPRRPAARPGVGRVRGRGRACHVPRPIPWRSSIRSTRGTSAWRAP